MSAPIQETETTINTELDLLCINTIRMLSLDAVQQAQSGHPGLPLGAAPMAYVLWTRFLRHNPQQPKWENRDRFLLSAGHGSMLLYSLLHLTGYDLPLDELKRFRQFAGVAAEEREIVGALRVIGRLRPQLAFAKFERPPQEALALVQISGSVFEKSQPVHAAS